MSKFKPGNIIIKHTNETEAIVKFIGETQYIIEYKVTGDQTTLSFNYLDEFYKLKPQKTYTDKDIVVGFKYKADDTIYEICKGFKGRVVESYINRGGDLVGASCITESIVTGLNNKTYTEIKG